MASLPPPVVTVTISGSSYIPSSLSNIALVTLASFPGHAGRSLR
jgi:hypothetical protein